MSEETEKVKNQEDIAAEWAAAAAASSNKIDMGQSEIDSLFGEEVSDSKVGFKALIEQTTNAYDRLPMLEVVADRLVRTMSNSFRNFTSDNIDVEIVSISTLKFEDYINSIPMPAILNIFKILEWDNFGIISPDSKFVSFMIDNLFGGRKNKSFAAEIRPYTIIEQTLVRQCTEIILSDLANAFDALSPATFVFERTENNPKFAAITRSAEPAILISLKLYSDDRDGKISILFPYETLSPIYDLLTQVFIGDKFNKDIVWEQHMEQEALTTMLDLDVRLGEKSLTLEEISNFNIGDIILLDKEKDDDIDLLYENILLFRGKLGSYKDSIALEITTNIEENIKNKF